MGALLGTIGVLSMLFTIGALIKPEPLKKLFKENTRMKIALTFGLGGFILLAIGVGGTTPNGWQPNQTVTNQSTAQTSAASNAPQDPASQIKAIVGNVLQGQTNESNEPKLRSVDVEPDVVKGWWDVTVDFNGDNNITNGMTKNGLESQTADVFIALYTSGQKIEIATVTGYLPVTDKYGNTSDGIVYRATLDTDTAAQINWSDDKPTLELQILPGVWDLDFVNPAFE
jgi:hypothetical protein